MWRLDFKLLSLLIRWCEDRCLRYGKPCKRSRVGNLILCAVLSLIGTFCAHSRTYLVVTGPEYAHKYSEDWEPVSVGPAETLLKQVGFIVLTFAGELR